MNGIMEGLLYINDRDVWTDFGAWLVEDEEGETKNYSALMKFPAVKDHVVVDFRERDGEKLPEKLEQRWQPRDVSLKFAIAAADKAAFMLRRNAFISFLKTGDNGWLNLRLPELGMVYRVHYKDCQDYEHIEDVGGMVAGKFTVKFREPNPERQQCLNND